MSKNNTLVNAVPSDEISDPDTFSQAVVALLEVWNMDCHHCATCVRNGLLQVDGVYAVDVFFEKGIAAATYDPGCIAIDDLLSVIKRAGREARRYYGAELIGTSPVVRPLALPTKEVISETYRR